MKSFVLWFIIIVISFIATSWRLSLKHATNVGLSPESVYILTSLGWVGGSLLLFIVLHRKFVDEISTDLTSLKHSWPSVVMLVTTASLFAVSAYVFYGLIQKNNVSTLFPVRSVLIMTMVIAGGTLLLRERIRLAQGISLTLFVLGIIIMMGDTFLTDKGSI